MRRPGRKTSCYIATTLTRASVRPPSLIVTRTATADEKDEAAAAGHAQEKNLNMSRIVCHTPTNHLQKETESTKAAAAKERRRSYNQISTSSKKKHNIQYLVSLPIPHFLKTRFFRQMVRQHGICSSFWRFVLHHDDLITKSYWVEMMCAMPIEHIILFFFSSSY